MPVRLLAALIVLIALAALPSLWGFIAAAILLIAWLRRAQRASVAARSLPPSTGTFVALTLYAALLAIVLLTARAALGWLERPVLALEQTGIAPYFARGSLGFYDKSELRLALLQLLVLWGLFAAVLVEMWSYQARRFGNARAVHPLSALFVLVLYFSAVHLPPYSTRLGVSIAAMIGQLVAGTALFALIRKLTSSRAMALLGASYVLLVDPVTDLSPWVFVGALLYLAFVLRRVSRGRRLTGRQLFVGGSLVLSIACTSLSADWALYWVLVPGAAYVAYGLVRMLSIRFRRASGASMAAAHGFVPLAFCALFVALFPLGPFNERVASYTTRYEPAREAWYRQCARGGDCDPGHKPSLAAALREALR